MDIRNRHPLNAIEGYENLSMLETLIPFVDYSLKLPLALFIKFSEIRLIINCLSSQSNLIRMGLHCANSDPLDMVCAMTGMSPDMMKMLFSMLNNKEGDLFSMMNNFGDDFGSNFSAEQVTNMLKNMQGNQEDSLYTNPSGTGNANCDATDFDRNIENLFAEYDKQQKTKAACCDETSFSHSGHSCFPR